MKVHKINSHRPKSKALIERDQKVISPSYPRGDPFVMSHGSGSKVWDVDGNSFIDFMGGIAVVSTGYSHPKVVKAIQQQAEKFIHISSDYYHESMVSLGEKLNEIAPFEEDARVFLTNSGTEAVETAIKLARYHTKRSNLIGFLGAFHGRTMGSVTMTASKSKYHKGFYPLMNGVTHAPFPDPYRPILERKFGEDYGETVVRYIEDNILGQLVPYEDMAGILVEPIQGEGGYIVPSPGFFPALRKLCDKYGILLICDEVQSGMGRTGKWWAIQNFGVEPDIITSAKGIASGMPLGACIARKSIMTWPNGSHGNTYGGNPLACVASLATIDVLENGGIQNAIKEGHYFKQKLIELQQKYNSIGDVRGIGLMIGVDFVEDRDTKKPDGKLVDKIVTAAYERGLLLLSCSHSTIRIAPPLTITREEIDTGLTILEEAIKVSIKNE